VATGIGPYTVIRHNNIHTYVILLHVSTFFEHRQGGIQQIQTRQWLFTPQMFNSTFKYKYYKGYGCRSIIQTVCHDCYYIGWPKVGIQTIPYYILYTVYLLLAHPVRLQINIYCRKSSSFSRICSFVFWCSLFRQERINRLFFIHPCFTIILI